MNKNQVKLEVEKFRTQRAYGKSVADCFPPWFLTQTYNLPFEEATRRSSEEIDKEGGTRGYDFGIDAYFIDETPNPKLTIIQAKYSSSISYVSKGFTDLKKSLPHLQTELAEVGSVNPMENKVLVNMRADLNRLEKGTKEKLSLEFLVIHLCDEDKEIINNKTSTARENLKSAIADTFPDRLSFIKDIGPNEMGPQKEVVAPSPWLSLTLNYCPEPVRVLGAEMHYGIGMLHELVELYRLRRDALFSKNVRYFIKKKSNTEKGAAGKMKQTLKQICSENNLQPDIFALYHNGITLLASTLETCEKGVRIKEPYVLNGCQTIKNAYMYFYSPRVKTPDEEKWKQIPVPLRILCTKDESIVRFVTVNNNRQNAISFAALKANDPIQIQLEERFRKAKIFYERQEGAYKSLEDSNPELLEDEYENTRGEQVNIVDLARSIAAASGEITYAKHPNELFESDAAYNRVFSAKRLSSLTFLTFLQNLHDVIPIILKKDLELRQEGKGPKPGSLEYYALCLLVRYLAKKQETDIIREFGGDLWGRKPQFRKRITKLLDNYHSGIKGILENKFLTLDDSTAESLNDAFARSQAVLSLKNDIDVFESFKNLEQIEEVE